MSNIIGLNTKLFGLEKNIKQSELTRAANDLGQLGDSAKKERVLNPIVSESYMQKYIEEHGGGGGAEMETIDVTIINNTGNEFRVSMGFGLSSNNNALIPYTDVSIPTNSSVTHDIICMYHDDMYGFAVSYITQSMSGYYVTTPSDAVNCTAMEDLSGVTLFVTTTGSPSSVTLTITYVADGGGQS